MPEVGAVMKLLAVCDRGDVQGLRAILELRLDPNVPGGWVLTRRENSQLCTGLRKEAAWAEK